MIKIGMVSKLIWKQYMKLILIYSFFQGYFLSSNHETSTKQQLLSIFFRDWPATHYCLCRLFTIHSGFYSIPPPPQAQVLNCSTCDCDHVCDLSLCRFKDFGIRSISNDGQPYERRRFETQTQGRSHVETESYASQDTLRRVRCHQKLGERHGMSFQKGPSLFDFRLLISIFINCERKNFS